jgi:WD40 repeat protein
VQELGSTVLVVAYHKGLIDEIYEGNNFPNKVAQFEGGLRYMVKYSESEIFVAEKDSIILLDSHYQINKIFRGHESKIEKFFYGDDTLYSVSKDFRVMSWNIESTESTILYTHDSRVKEIDYSSELKLIASSSDKSVLILYSISQGRALNKIEDIKSGIKCLKFIPNKNLIAIGLFNSSILLKSVPSLENFQVLKGHSSKIKFIDYYKDAGLLVSTSNDQKIGFWNLETFSSNIEKTSHEDPIIQVLFGKNGKIFTVGMDEKLIQHKFTGELKSDSVYLDEPVQYEDYEDHGVHKSKLSGLLKVELVVLVVLLLYVIIEYLSGGALLELFFK